MMNIQGCARWAAVMTASGRGRVRCRLRDAAMALGVAGGVATAQAATPGPEAEPPPQVSLQAVAPGVWFAQGAAALGSSANRNFISNAAAVVTPDGVLVIDALGSPALAEEFLQALAAVTPLPVRTVVVTHYHADHIYGLQAFQARGATIVAQRRSAEYLSSDTARLRLAASREEMAPWVDARTRLVAPDRIVDDRLELSLGGERFVLLHVGPAHTSEDLVVLMPSRGILFSGDLVFRGRIPFVGQADSARWIAALDELVALRPQVVVPGHGPVSRQADADLKLTRDYLVYLRETMGEAARNLEPFDEVYARTDWSRFESLPLFRVANRMNAYNTFLLMEQSGGRR
jgi:glyoxylase-like metal-dependent hydrolase (beta-lactamase superfamily II)